MTAAPDSQHGFTLIELMVTVAIAAILMAIAYPSYQSYIINGNRTDAEGALMAFTTAMERYKSDNSSYLGAQASGGFPSAPVTTVYPSQSPVDSSNKAYDLSIQSATSGAYVLRATPISGSVQSGNGYLEITSTGVKRWDENNNGSIGSGENDWGD